MFSLEGKNALVIGATAGLGLGVARQFAKAGAKVVIAGRRDNGAELAASFGAEFVNIDATSEESIAAGLAAAEEKIGKLHIVVNNAGVYPTGSYSEATAEDQKWNLDVNVNGVLWSLKHASGHMHEGGSIINTTSLLATWVLPGTGYYSAAKAAVSSMTRSAALEYAEMGVRVNAVAPSTILDTEHNQHLPEAERVVCETFSPARRASVIDDYLGTYQFLASDASQYISGQIIAVDAGLSAGASIGLLEKLLG